MKEEMEANPEAVLKVLEFMSEQRNEIGPEGSVLTCGDDFGRVSLEILQKLSSVSLPVDYDSILELQSPDGYWDLNELLEEYLRIPKGYLKEILQSVDYHNIGKSKATLAERQFATAIVIELFKRSFNPLLIEDYRIKLAIKWLRETELEEISLCYVLGLSSNWMAKSIHVLTELEFILSVCKKKLYNQPKFNFFQ